MGVNFFDLFRATRDHFRHDLRKKHHVEDTYACLVALGSDLGSGVSKYAVLVEIRATLREQSIPDKNNSTQQTLSLVTANTNLPGCVLFQQAKRESH